jgi:hypothetical protein
MGILISHVHFLAKENENHPIKGKVLTLGQQGVLATLIDVKKIIESYGTLYALKSDFDTKNKIPEWIGTENEKFTNAQTIFSLLGAEKVYACDYSDYENPDFIFDLNYQVGDEYKERFDVIFDSGTLEHIFDISTALNNVDFMLKKGGQLIIFSPASNMVDHGFYSFSPTLFYDYFKNREYNNFSCYLREAFPFNVNKRGKTYKYHNVGDQLPLFSKHSLEVIFFANKGENNRKDKMKKPIQSLYVFKFSVDSKAEKHRTISKFIMKKIYFFVKPIIPSFFTKLIRQIIRKKNIANISYLGRY